MRWKKNKKKITWVWYSEFFILFYFIISWHFFIIKIWVNIARQTFLKLKIKPLATSAFSIQHLTVRTILTQGWKVEDQFDTRLKGWGPIWHSWKVRDQFATKAKGWGPKQYLNLYQKSKDSNLTLPSPINQPNYHN